MRIIRQLAEADLEEYITISAQAYPAFNVVTEADRDRFRERLKKRMAEPTAKLYGLLEDDKLVGVMNLYDFTMTLLSVRTLVGGLGAVAVDLLHKKEKVARDMVRYFLRHYYDKGACLTALYPFRPDFYKQMGFGYGAKMNQYRFKPDSLPKGPTKAHITFLREADKAALWACYQRLAMKTNGLMDRAERDVERLFEDTAIKLVGYKQEEQLLGYIAFTFQPSKAGNFLSNNMLIREFVYESSEALRELLTFLHTQADQIDRIIFNTQDETFHHLLSDPRNETGNILPPVFHESNAQGVGIMYRVINTPRLFKVLAGHNFGGQSCRLKLSLVDSFFPENGDSTIIHFVAGRAELALNDDYDVEVALDVAEFSSLITGVVSFRQLVNYGLAYISDDAYLETVHALFYTEQKPWCMTPF